MAIRKGYPLFIKKISTSANRSQLKTDVAVLMFCEFVAIYYVTPVFASKLLSIKLTVSWLPNISVIDPGWNPMLKEFSLREVEFLNVIQYVVLL